MPNPPPDDLHEPWTDVLHYCYPRASPPRIPQANNLHNGRESDAMGIWPSAPATTTADLASDEYTYQPLKTHQSIRVLMMEPSASYDEPVRCGLESTSLEAPLPFYAVSYVWGRTMMADLGSHETLYVENRPLRVPYRLHTALKAIRQQRLSDTDAVFSIWMDSICINQEDEDECSSQSRLIAKIFQASKQIIILMGSYIQGRSNVLFSYLAENISERVSLATNAYSVLARKRDELLLGYTQHTHEMAKYQQARRFTDESITALVETFSLQSESGLAQTPNVSFSSMKRQLKDDGEVLSHSYQAAMQMEHTLGSLEWEVAGQEAHFMSAIKQLVQQMPACQPLLSNIEAVRDPPEKLPSETSDHLPEEAEKYFSLMGEISLLRDREIELSQGHALSRAQRDFERDQEREPEVPDKAFERNFEQACESLQQDLAAARSKAEALRADCETLGIDLESLRHRAEPDDSTAASSTKITPPPWPDATEVEVMYRIMETNGGDTPFSHAENMPATRAKLRQAAGSEVVEQGKQIQRWLTNLSIEANPAEQGSSPVLDRSTESRRQRVRAPFLPVLKRMSSMPEL